MKNKLLLVLALLLSFSVCSAANLDSVTSFLYAADGQAIEVDDATGTLQTIEYEHHEIHAGSHFYICGFDTYNNGQGVTFSVTTPDTAKWLHMSFEIEGTTQTEIYIYEDATITGGTTQNAKNNDRNSSKTSVATIKTGATVSSAGTLIFSQSKGFDQANPARADSEGLIGREREIILKQNSTTLFYIVSRGNSNIISYCGEWYEHTNKR